MGAELLVEDLSELLTIPIEIRLARTQYEALCEMIPDETGVAQQLSAVKIANLANGVVNAIADGGMVLEAPYVDRVMRVLKTTSLDSERVVQAVERAHNVKAGKKIIPIEIDASIAAALTENAGMQDMTPEEALTNTVVFAASQYINNMQIMGRTFTLTVDQERDIERAFGSKVDIGTLVQAAEIGASTLLDRQAEVEAEMERKRSAAVEAKRKKAKEPAV